MEQEIIQIGTIGVFAMLVIREGINLFKWLWSSKKNGNGITKTDNQQAVDIAKIQIQLKMYEENHFPHIQKCLEENSKEHTEIKILLGRIDEKLK